MSTQAFVNVVDGVDSSPQTDASAAKFLNLHLGCVVNDVKHRTANGRTPDKLTTDKQRRQVVSYLKSIDARTASP